MKVSQIIYDLIRSEFPDTDVYMDFIPQDVNLQSTTGIILIKDMTSESPGTKDLTSATRVHDSTYRIEVIGHQDAYMALEEMSDLIEGYMTGYTDTDITLIDYTRSYNDGNAVAEVKRFIKDFTIIHTK